MADGTDQRCAEPECNNGPGTIHGHSGLVVHGLPLHDASEVKRSRKTLEPQPSRGEGQG